MATFQTTEDERTWASWLAEMELDDVYCSFRYASIWSREEHGNFVGLRYESEAGRVLYPLLLVPLDRLPGGSGLFEARTPYDFGGPRAKGPNLTAVHASFRDALLEWLQSRGVISEFARLHPLADAGWPPDAILHADNFVVDLSVPYTALFESQHRRHRRAVRAYSRRSGGAEVVEHPSNEDIAAFIGMYATTMRRAGANPEYLFTEETLGALISLDEMVLVRALDGETAQGAALFLRSGRDLFYFLGASVDDRPPGTNNAIFDAAIRHGQSRQHRTLHLGGGSMSLRDFKAQIATSTAPYRLLKRVVDESRYAALNAACGVSDSAEFPAFRRMLLERRRG